MAKKNSQDHSHLASTVTTTNDELICKMEKGSDTSTNILLTLYKVEENKIKN